VNWRIVSRRRLDAALAEISQLRDRVTAAEGRVVAAEERHGEVEGKRRNLARWLAEEKSTNTRLSGRIDELTKRLDARPVFEESSALRSRIRHLEKQLDDAVGLTPGRPKNSGPWQPGYEAPSPDAKASAS